MKIAVVTICKNEARFVKRWANSCSEADAWGWLPYDLGAIAAWHLGNKELAQVWGTQALELNPADDRLQRNLKWYV